MIAQSEIEGLITNGEISISYTFAHFADGQQQYLQDEQFVNFADTSLPATRMFIQNFFADRLMLTLGPIAKTHERKYFSKRPAYKARLGYFDLRESNNQIVIEPHETISVATNEHIIMGPHIGAYIIPRLRNLDSGILFMPSYIDPYWDGILQGIIVNVTDYRQTLSLAEGIAICRFYYIAGKVSEDVKTRFPSKSHHFGQSWPKILIEDAEPFPRRKIPVPSSSFDRRWDNLCNLWYLHWRKLASLGYGGGIILLLYAAFELNSSIKKIPGIETNIKNLTDKWTKTDSQVSTISGSLARTGIIVIDIPRGNFYASRSFEIQRSTSSLPTIWASSTRSIENIILKARTEPSPADSRKIIVTITVSLSRPSNGDSMEIQWLLVSS